jgi:diguanylate cyclase (GGDEF)-like protein
MTIREALLSLAGLSLGDAFGQSLFFYGSEDYVRWRTIKPGPWHWTDDTQMAISVVEELQKRDWIDQDYLARHMAWRYSTDPARGYSSGTRKILEGIAQGEYFRSAVSMTGASSSSGNSVAARAVPIGAYFQHTLYKAISEARLSAAVTHMHPEALAAAEAVAAAAVLACAETPLTGGDFLQKLLLSVSQSQLRDRIEKALPIGKEDLPRALKILSAGEPNRVQSVVPFALWVAAHNLLNYEDALWTAAAYTQLPDTSCAIVGGIVALSARKFPEEWVERCESLPDTLFAPPDLAAAAAPLPAPAQRKPRGIQPRPGSQAGSQPAPLGELSSPGPAAEPPPPIDLVREPVPESALHPIQIDALTGLPNLVGLLTWFRKRRDSQPFRPFSLVGLQMAGLWDVNRIQGRTAGDDLLRWSAQTLSPFSPANVYRAGGDKFAFIYEGSGREEVLATAARAAQSVTKAGIRPPRLVVISFGSPELVSPGYALASLDVALANRNFLDNDGRPRELDPLTIRATDTFPWMMADIADQFLQLASRAGEYARQAVTDSVSQLPNQRAAMIELDKAVSHARSSGGPLAVLMIDGDNLRRYNEVSYNEGDKAIQQIGATLKAQLRESDFTARWRTGDEFLILLPGAVMEQALATADRLCAAVAHASQNWLYPTTISIGVALYPDHGPTVQDLLTRAEQGLEQAKHAGKNQVRVAENGEVSI